MIELTRCSSGHTLIGRVDATRDCSASVLRVDGVCAERGALRA